VRHGVGVVGALDARNLDLVPAHATGEPAVAGALYPVRFVARRADRCGGQVAVTPAATDADAIAEVTETRLPGVDDTTTSPAVVQVDTVVVVGAPSQLATVERSAAQRNAQVKSFSMVAQPAPG
jgi:hypothetical protein